MVFSVIPRKSNYTILARWTMTVIKEIIRALGMVALIPTIFLKCFLEVEWEAWEAWEEAWEAAEIRSLLLGLVDHLLYYAHKFYTYLN